MTESLRRRAGFKKHPHQVWAGREGVGSIDVILEKGDNTPNWIAETTRKIPEWRRDVKDVYLRWAITINAMHVARNRHELNPNLGLETSTYRIQNEHAQIVVLETWTALDTARNYDLSIPSLSAFALTDLYGLLEEIIFEMYLIYLNDDPSELIKGDEFRELRRLHRRKDQGRDAADEWETAWAARLQSWQRKRAYDGLHNVFKAYFHNTGLKRPIGFTKSDIDDWAQVIEAIGQARNLIVHGVGSVSEKLASITSKIRTNVFLFQEGQELNIKLEHLMFTECFCDQLFNALNTSLVEKAHPELTKLNS